jgi:hypothetical protein
MFPVWEGTCPVKILNLVVQIGATFGLNTERKFHCKQILFPWVNFHQLTILFCSILFYFIFSKLLKTGV